MTDVSGNYTGLTEDELAELSAASKQHSGEDSSTWAQRAQALAAEAQKRAEARRAAIAAPIDDEEAG